MNVSDKDLFLTNSQTALRQMFDVLNQLSYLNISDFKPENTAIVIVDVINGFAKEGPLSSPRVNDLIPGIVNLMEKFKGFPMVAFADCHTNESPEFDSYPVHCLNSTTESQVVDEIKNVGGYTLIYKNSTNGYLGSSFSMWLYEHPDIRNFIVVGDCTDICISQLALTLKTRFNTNNVRGRVIVPTELVDTFDLGMHNADLMNVVSLIMMQGSGVELVKNFK